MRRRDVLRLGLTAGCTLAGIAGSVRRTHARAFGEVPEGSDGFALPSELRVKNVLEVFLFGGLSQYETFLCHPEDGKSDGTHLQMFLRDPAFEQLAATCGFPSELTEPFGGDADGREVHFGPAAWPLRARSDVMDRTRLLVAAHALEPHEGAIPLAATGRRPGHPAMAALGTHIQRAAHLAEPTRAIPFSYVLQPEQAVLVELMRAASLTGLHPGSSRPLVIKMTDDSELYAALGRPAVERPESHDALVRAAIQRYDQRFHGPSGAVRVSRLGDVSAAHQSVESAPQLRVVLPESLFTGLPGAACGVAEPVDATRMSLRAAVRLLRHEQTPAKYVCVIDGGLLPAAGTGGYDSHGDNSLIQATNTVNVLSALMDRINRPGEDDPEKLNLDETLICINTEFGRTPFEEGLRGRGHWPYGYPVLMLGGPTRRSIVGAVGPDARATQSITPVETRIALMVALGMWPFAQESFNVSDVPDQFSESRAAADTARRLLGVEVS